MIGFVKQRRRGPDGLWAWEKIELALELDCLFVGGAGGQRIDYAHIEHVASWQSGFDVVRLGGGSSLSFIAESAASSTEWVGAILHRLGAAPPRDSDDALRLLEREASRPPAAPRLSGGRFDEAHHGLDVDARAPRKPRPPPPGNGGAATDPDLAATATRTLSRSPADDSPTGTGRSYLGDASPGSDAGASRDAASSWATHRGSAHDPGHRRVFAGDSTIETSDVRDVGSPSGGDEFSRGNVVLLEQQRARERLVARHFSADRATVEDDWPLGRLIERDAADAAALRVRHHDTALVAQDCGLRRPPEQPAAMTAGTQTLAPASEDAAARLAVRVAALTEEVASLSMRRAADAAAHAAARRADVDAARALQAEVAALRRSAAANEAARGDAERAAGAHRAARDRAEAEARGVAADNASLGARCSAARDVARTDRACAEQLAKRLEIALDENAHLENEWRRAVAEKRTLVDTLERHDKLLYGRHSAQHGAQHLLKPKQQLARPQQSGAFK
ncbi:hypothetical protein M885DRAFT_588047 [Pelagophyceae sp. CCMP2097]|nr:hypothetical protein M885DRAFT_588047 [Pelagophyceae sp. CCMP2097]